MQPWASSYLAATGAKVAPGIAGTIPGAGQFVNQSPFAEYPYPFQQVAPMSDDQLAGIAGVRSLGNEAPLVNQAIQYQSDVMGQNAINNPLLGEYFTAAADPLVRSYRLATAPGLTTSALKAGAFGSSGHQQARAENERGLGESLSKLGTSIYTPAWQEQERLRQTAALASPSLTQAAYFPSERLMQTGATEQKQAQDVLNAAFQNLFNMADWPFKIPEFLSRAITAMTGQTGTQTLELPTVGPFGPFIAGARA